ncbi:MAG: glycosyltransferase family 4 protein [Terracidiphilus sp.]|nr:glycosyltransferase family 4 protein [Terracidiphilus sp.]
MKILLFAQSFPPPSAGGSVQYIATIFSLLPHQTAVIVTGNAEPALAQQFDAGYPQRILRFSFIAHVLRGYKVSKIARICEYLLWPLTAGWLILRERPQVVHIGEFNAASIAVLVAKKLLRVPYVMFTYAEEITYITGRPMYLRLLKRVLCNADAVITVSDYTVDILRELGVDSTRIHKVLPAVGREKLVAAAEDADAIRKRYSLRNCRVLLTVGRLVERKGHATVIEALTTILQSFPTVRYVIVGTGPDEDKLKKMVRQAGLQNYVLFTGEIDNNELACWYEICDIFVMPHRSLPVSRDTEGCPTVFLEASAHGKPVIGGRDGGVTDAILHDRTGFIIDGTDASKLAESVCYLLRTPEHAARMGAAGRAYVATLSAGSRAAAIQEINARVIVGDCAVGRG